MGQNFRNSHKGYLEDGQYRKLVEYCLALAGTLYAISATLGRMPVSTPGSLDCYSMIFGEPQPEISEERELQRVSL